MKAILAMLCMIALTAPHVVHAKGMTTRPAPEADVADKDDFNPFDPNVEAKLKALDKIYEKATKKKAILTVDQNADHADGEIPTPQLEVHPAIIPLDATPGMSPANPGAPTPEILNPEVLNPSGDVQPQFPEGLQSKACRGMECHIFIDVNKTKQQMNLYEDGVLKVTSPTSTGRAGFATPNFETNPNGRIYQVYSSSKYPGYNNMPFAVFIQGGFALHGAPGSEDKELGHVASHGCVRLRTSKAQEVNAYVSAAVKAAGGTTKTVWISVHN
jgi:lipoprotein-anchoring transpeptidase ErfK/SrfK